LVLPRAHRSGRRLLGVDRPPAAGERPGRDLPRGDFLRRLPFRYLDALGARPPPSRVRSDVGRPALGACRTVVRKKNLRWFLGTAVASLLSAALIASVWTADAAGTKTAVLQDETDLIAVGLGSGHRNFDIWLVDPTGARVKRLTTDAGIDAMPTWSPDGSRIAY